MKKLFIEYIRLWIYSNPKYSRKNLQFEDLKEYISNDVKIKNIQSYEKIFYQLIKIAK